MRTQIIAVTVLSITLTAGCGHSPDQLITALPQEAPATTAPAPQPPVAPPPVAPVCKSLFSAWITHTQPQDEFLGRYYGPNTNGPYYTFDLTGKYPGDNSRAAFRYDATHSCTYDVTLLNDRVTINLFVGCDPWILPGHTVNTQCDYCPDAYKSKVFPIELTCNQLKITDPATGDVYTYQ